jgi:hypothetical protein
VTDALKDPFGALSLSCRWFLGVLVVVRYPWFGGGGGILRVAHSRVKGASRRPSADDGLAAVTLDPRASATLSRLYPRAGWRLPALPATTTEQALLGFVSCGLATVPGLSVAAGCCGRVGAASGFVVG